MPESLRKKCYTLVDGRLDRHEVAGKRICATLPTDRKVSKTRNYRRQIRSTTFQSTEPIKITLVTGHAFYKGYIKAKNRYFVVSVRNATQCNHSLQAFPTPNNVLRTAQHSKPATAVNSTVSHSHCTRTECRAMPLMETHTEGNVQLKVAPYSAFEHF